MSDSASPGSQPQGGALNSVAKGGIAFGAGAIGAKLLVLITGLIIIRSVDKTEFGLITLAYIITTVFSHIALLGFGNGVPRLMAQKGQRNADMDASYSAGAVAGTSFLIVFSVCLLATLGLYLCSGKIAMMVDKPGLEGILKAFAFMVIPLAMIQNFTSAFQGIRITRTRMLFQDWTSNLVKLILVLALLVIGFTLERLIFVYVAAVWTAFILYALYSARELPNRLDLGVSAQAGRQLLMFCIPLLAASLTSRLGNWSGTLILGYAQTAEQIALYNAPFRVVDVLLVPLAALNFIYIPIATRMHISGSLEQHRELYASITKIASMVTFPLVLFCVFEAKFVVETLFGKEYSESANVLRILAIGYGVHTAFGPNGSTLISYGHTRPILWAAALSSTITVCVSLLLVKGHGAVGVALGAISGMIAANLLQHYYVYSRTGVSPFDKAWRASCLVFFTLSMVVYALILHLMPTGYFSYFATLLILFLCGIASPIIARSLNSEDIALLTAMELKLLNGNKYSTALKNWLN